MTSNLARIFGFICIGLLVSAAQCPRVVPNSRYGPSVVRVVPADGSQAVSTLGTTVQVDFDQAIDPSSARSPHLELEGPVGAVSGTWQVVSGSTRATFTSTNSLLPSALYKVHVRSGVRNPNGHPMKTPFESRFRTLGATRLRAGVGTSDVTPPVGTPLAGFGGGIRRLWPPDFNPRNLHQFMAPSTSVHDSLIAKALVLDDGQDRIAIVKLDLVAVDESLVHDIARGVLGETGIPESNLFVCATHTHSGPGTLSKSFLWQMITMDLFQKQIYDLVTQGAIRAIKQANKGMQDARLGVGFGRQLGLQRNRRGHPGRHDSSVGVIRVDSARTGQPIAVVVNYSLHPVCLGTMAISADFPGYLERHIEAKLPGAVGFYLNAAEGDVSPTRKGYAGAKWIGETLGNTALGIRAQTATRQQVDLRPAYGKVNFSKATLFLSCQQPKFRQEAKLWNIDLCQLYGTVFGTPFQTQTDVSTLVPLSFPMRALRIDNVLIGCIPGEPITAIGNEVKKRAAAHGYTRSMVWGLCGGHVAYVTDPLEYDEGGYEAMGTLYGRQQGPTMIQVLDGLFSRIK